MYSCHACPWSSEHRPSHPYNTGTEHVGSSPTRQKMLAPSAKLREVFGESHEGRAASYLRSACEAAFGTLCVHSCIWMTASTFLICFTA